MLPFEDADVVVATLPLLVAIDTEGADVDGTVEEFLRDVGKVKLVELLLPDVSDLDVRISDVDEL